METQQKRKYLSIRNIQEEYLPISRKKIRSFVKQHLAVKMIGDRMYVDREDLEAYLSGMDNPAV